MIHKVILENGRYIGQSRLDESKYLPKDYAIEILPYCRKYYGVNAGGFYITNEAKKTEDNLYNRIKRGFEALHQTGLNNKKQYIAIANFLRSEENIYDDDNNLTPEALNILNILEGI